MCGSKGPVSRQEETAGRRMEWRWEGRKEGSQRLTDKQTYREGKKGRPTNTCDNQSSCGLIAARLGTVGED